MNDLVKWVESSGSSAPWLFAFLFLLGSFVTIWRLEVLNKEGFDGTVLGTLIMPYCSGIGNLIFAFEIGTRGGAGKEILINSVVNNMTNMTLLLGLPAIVWGLNLVPAKSRDSKKPRKTQSKKAYAIKINRLSLLLTLAAVIFFTATVMAVSRDGTIDAGDGMVLVGIFLFWQCFHVFEVLKSNAAAKNSFSWMLIVNLLLLGLGAYAVYFSTDWLVTFVNHSQGKFINAGNLGWLSGWLMVLPNAMLAFYYARQGKPEVVYASQIGDGHISIPLSIGLCALFKPIAAGHFFLVSCWMLLGAAILHFGLITVVGRLPKWIAWLLCGLYLMFLYRGFA